jgi:hypothetical protein
MALGISFGKKKSSSSGVRTTDSTVTQNQTGTTAQNQQQTTNSLSQTNTTGSQTTNSQSQQAATSSTGTRGSQTQTGRTQTFSDDVLAALEAAGLSTLGRANDAGRVDTSALGSFNPQQFINDAVTQSEVASRRQRNIAEYGLNDSLGGTSGGNTMAALLAQELAQQEAGYVAGARNQATAQAMDILRQNIGTNIAATGQDQDFTTRLLASLQGGQQITTGETQTQQDQSTQSQQVGSDQSTQLSSQQQQAQTQQINNLVSLITQLVSGSTRTVGTETENTKTKGSGGGFGLSL